MKIAVTSTGPTLDDMMEARFGRCPYFLIIDLDNMEFEAEVFAKKRNITVMGRVPFDPAFTRTMVQGKTIVEFDSRSKGCEAVKGMMTLTGPCWRLI